MVTKELLEYIERESTKGIDRTEIEKLLLGVGWVPKDVNDALDQTPNNNSKFQHLFPFPTRKLFVISVVSIIFALSIIAAGFYFLNKSASINNLATNNQPVELASKPQYLQPRQINQSVLDPTAYLDIKEGFKIHPILSYGIYSGGSAGGIIAGGVPRDDPGVKRDENLGGFYMSMTITKIVDPNSESLEDYLKRFNKKEYEDDLTNYSGLSIKETVDSSGGKMWESKMKGLSPYTEDKAPYKIIENGRIKLGDYNAIIARGGKPYVIGNELNELYYKGATLLLIEKEGAKYLVNYSLDTGLYGPFNKNEYKEKVLKFEDELDKSIESLLSFGFINPDDYDTSRIDESRTVWLEKEIEVPPDTETDGMIFDYEFNTTDANPAGFFRVFFDNKLRMVIDERFVFAGKKSKFVPFDKKYSQGKYKLLFRVDPLSQAKTETTIENVRMIDYVHQ